jgi:hypothetical protein
MPDYLDPLTGWPCPPPPGYRGQMDDGFQKDRAALYQDVGADDCAWYHTTQVPGGEVRAGQWDLRGREADYLGGVDLAGKTVLEFGPASGHLTFYMESQGAAVTAFEVGYDAHIAMVPSPGEPDLAAREADLMAHTRRTVNAWWFLHRAYGSNAKLVHGDIYRTPDDLGTHDVVVLGSILLHCRDFARVLHQAARHATSTVVVAEPYHPELDVQPRLLSFLPEPAESGATVTWWMFSPAAIGALLWRMGFPHPRLHRHTQAYHDEGGAVRASPYFTVVADRGWAGPGPVPGWMADPGAEQRGGCPPQVDLTAENRRLLDRVHALESSRTMRWTAPARRLYGQVRRRG